MDRCDILGGVLSFGINQAAEEAGLKPLPLGSGQMLELNPGFLVKREMSLLCKKDTSEKSILSLDLKQLSPIVQSYLMDRMTNFAAEQQDKKLGVPGQRLASPSFSLGFIGLKGEGSVVVWRDPSKSGVDQLNGFMVKFTFFEGK